MKQFIKCKDYKTYNKILRRRKYLMRHEWWHDRDGKCHNPQFRYKYRVWLSYEVTSIEEAKQVLKHKKWCKGNLPIILNEYIENYGKEATGYNAKHPILCGVEMTNEDYYWIYECEDGSRILGSCVGKWNNC